MSKRRSPKPLSASDQPLAWIIEWVFAANGRRVTVERVRRKGHLTFFGLRFDKDKAGIGPFTHSKLKTFLGARWVHLITVTVGDAISHWLGVRK